MCVLRSVWADVRGEGCASKVEALEDRAIDRGLASDLQSFCVIHASAFSLFLLRVRLVHFFHQRLDSVDERGEREQRPEELQRLLCSRLSQNLV